MTALALALAAALLAAGAAAGALRQYRNGGASLAVAVALMASVAGRSLDATAASVAVAAAIVPVIPPLAAWGAQRSTLLLRVALGLGLLAGPVAAVLYDAFLDPACVVDCRPNPLAVAHLAGLPHQVLALGAVVSAVALTAALLVGPHRLATAAPAVAAWWALGPLASDLPAVALAAGSLLVTVAARAARDWESRSRLAGLLRELEGAADLEATLRGVVGDPTLRVAFWLDEPGRLVTAAGDPAPESSPGQNSTDVRASGRLLARVYHHPRAVGVPALTAAITGPARLAFDNGRLSARLQAQASELRASRLRVVQHADAERRRMERDVHDGAQQHVLALGMVLTTDLERAADSNTSRPLLEECLAATRLMLDDLRELAHGLHPAGLESGGLAQALDTLVDQAPVPVTVTVVPPKRLPGPVERAAFQLLARLTADATEPLDIAVVADHREVTVTVKGGPPPDLVAADRLAVLGGTLHATRGGAGGPATVRVTLPLQQTYAEGEEDT